MLRARAVIAAACPLFAALLSSLPAPVAAGEDAYGTALAACLSAAAKAEEPTSFKCDWKAVVDGAPGAALSGRFKFQEPGSTGEMTILESPEAPARIGISTVTENAQAHTCSAALEATRDADVLVSKPADVEGCEVRITSGKEPDVVQVTVTDQCRAYYCGMRAGFDGKWKLVR